MERGVAALEIIPPRPMLGEEGGMIRIAPYFGRARVADVP